MEIRPGKSTAIEVPLHKWNETVAFYRDKVGLSGKRQANQGSILVELDTRKRL